MTAMPALQLPDSGCDGGLVSTTCGNQPAHVCIGVAFATAQVAQGSACVLRRDVAPRIGFLKPALIESRFFPALQVRRQANLLCACSFCPSSFCMWAPD